MLERDGYLPGVPCWVDTSQADPDAYGSVFGWETLDVGAGAMAWTLAGYGDFLQQRDPELRERVAAAGVPERFADVVATLNPIADDQPDRSAHWSVTFSVADADDGWTRRGAWRPRGRVPVRSAMGPDDGDRRSGGRDLHREPIRP
jgi:hypothetical protein